jgi:hypothetical protein
MGQAVSPGDLRRTGFRLGLNHSSSTGKQVTVPNADFSVPVCEEGGRWLWLNEAYNLLVMVPV